MTCNPLPARPARVLPIGETVVAGERKKACCCTDTEALYDLINPETNIRRHRRIAPNGSGAGAQADAARWVADRPGIEAIQ